MDSPTILAAGFREPFGRLRSSIWKHGKTSRFVSNRRCSAPLCISTRRHLSVFLRPKQSPFSRVSTRRHFSTSLRPTQSPSSFVSSRRHFSASLRPKKSISSSTKSLGRLFDELRNSDVSHHYRNEVPVISSSSALHGNDSQQSCVQDTSSEGNGMDFTSLVESDLQQPTSGRTRTSNGAAKFSTGLLSESDDDERASDFPTEAPRVSILPDSPPSRRPRSLPTPLPVSDVFAPERQHPCSKCDKIFSSRRHLSIHYELHRLKHVCSVCQKNFFLKSELDQHMITHSTNRTRYACAVCEDTFLQQSSLKKHYAKWEQAIADGAAKGIAIEHKASQRYGAVLSAV